MDDLNRREMPEVVEILMIPASGMFGPRLVVLYSDGSLYGKLFGQEWERIPMPHELGMKG